MIVLLYAITRSGGPAPEAEGLDGVRLRRIDEGPLGAIVGEHPLPPAAAGPVLLAYESVLEALMGARTIVPARFGTVAADDGPIREMLTERRDELLATIERISGAVEIAVHLDARSQTSPEATGTEYLTARLRDRQRLDAIEAATAGLFRERAEIPGRSTGYLVAADDAERFMSAASAAGAQVTGPWPPFSFVR